MSDEPDPPTAPSRVTVRDVLAIIGMVFQAAFVLAMSMNVAGDGAWLRNLVGRAGELVIVTFPLIGVLLLCCSP